MIISPPAEVLRAIDLALEEDVGSGDVTTEWTVPESRKLGAVIMAKAGGVIAGIDVADAVFWRIDERIETDLILQDGDPVRAGQEVFRLRGPARAILTGERVALNFMQRLSGIATLTRAFSDAIRGTEARILDTRKTTPGLRRLERAAVRAGGGLNHRFGLFDMVLIKENHIRAAGGIRAAVDAVKRNNFNGLAVEVETTSMYEVRDAVDCEVDRILFDNMPLDLLREAVEYVKAADPLIELEASGGITLQNVRAIAELGVDYISIGALTHSAPSLDLSLLIVPGPDEGR